MRRSIGLYVFFVVILLSAPETGADTEKVYQDWALRCQDDGSCKLEQQVYVKGADKAPLVHVIFHSQSQSHDLVMLLLVPLGVMLSPGLQLQVDQGTPQTFPLHHCRSEGCLAIFQLSPELRQSLEAGREAKVGFHTLNGSSIGVPVSLLGITAGLKALDKHMNSNKQTKNQPIKP